MKAKVTLITLITITIFFQSMYFFNKPNTVSFTENRTLAVFPEFNLKNFSTGTYQTKLEEALKDQIFGRTRIIEYANNVKGFTRICFNYVYDSAKKISTLHIAASKVLINTRKDTNSDLTHTNSSGSTLAGTTTTEGSGASTTSTPSIETSKVSPVQTTTQTATQTTTPNSAITPSPSTKLITSTPVMDSETQTNKQTNKQIDEPTTTSELLPKTPLPTTTTVKKTKATRKTATITPTEVKSITPVPKTSTPTIITQTPIITAIPIVPTPVPTEKSEFKCWLKPFGNLYSINGTDYLTRYPLLDNSEYKKSIRIKTNQINEMTKRHPELKIYIYYLTRSEDLKWFDKSENIKSFDYADYIQRRLPDSVNFKKSDYKDLNDYMDRSFMTDHHWNCFGSDIGYKEIYNMMDADLDLLPLKVPKLLTFGDLKYIGSRGSESGISVTSDIFKVYDYNLGQFSTYVGNKSAIIGAKRQYVRNNIDRGLYKNHYSIYYGYDDSNGSIVKHVFTGNKYNLLYIGDSNSKPIREVVASHFNTTIYLDYVAIKNYNVDDLIKENKIDIVLFSSQCKYWTDLNTVAINDGVPYYFRDYPSITD